MGGLGTLPGRLGGASPPTSSLPASKKSGVGNLGIETRDALDRLSTVPQQTGRAPRMPHAAGTLGQAVSQRVVVHRTQNAN